MSDKWVVLDVWYTVGNPYCRFQYILLEGAIERAKSLFENKYIQAVKLFDAQKTYLYLKK